MKLTAEVNGQFGVMEVMTKEIEVIYEGGIIWPVEPLELPEGTRLDVIVITHPETRLQP